MTGLIGMEKKDQQTRGRRLSRRNLGFLLAKAMQVWNDVLHEEFSRAGFPEIRPAYGSILIPLFEEDGLRMGDLALRSRLSKQTMTTLVRNMEDHGLVRREVDPRDTRAIRVYLTKRSREFEAIGERVLSRMDEAVGKIIAPAKLEDLQETLARLLSLHSFET